MVGNGHIRVYPVLWDGSAPSSFRFVGHVLWCQFQKLTYFFRQCDVKMPHDAEDDGGPTGCS